MPTVNKNKKKWENEEENKAATFLTWKQIIFGSNKFCRKTSIFEAVNHENYLN